MAFHGKILLVVAFAVFINKVRCEVDTTHSGYIYLNREINDVDKASIQIDPDDVGDAIPSESTSAPGHNPIQGITYEDLQSPEAMQLLTDEFVGLVETEIAADTVEQLMARAKAILTNENSLQTFKNLRGEIYKYMTNQKTLVRIKEFFENRYKFYVNKDTPTLIHAKYNKVESFVNNENIPKNIIFVKKMIIDFLTQSGDVQQTIAERFTLLFHFLKLPPIPWVLS